MNQTCKQIERALACGNKLGGAQHKHLDDCPSCLATQSLAQSLQSTLRATNKTAPTLGFRSRLEAQVHSRLRAEPMFALRSRVLCVAALLAAAFLFLTIRGDRASQRAEAPTFTSADVVTSEPAQPLQASDSSPTALPHFAADFVALADLESSLQLSANWDEILEPLAATEILAEEIGQ